MEDFIQWQKDMNGIYDKFRKLSKEVPLKGLENTIPENTAGYYLVFRLPSEMKQYLAKISEEISRTTPATPYSPELLHTTLSDFGIEPLRDFSLSLSRLSSVEEAVNERIKNHKPQRIRLGEILYNNSSVIVEGVSSGSHFYDLAKEIIEGCKQKGIGLRFPWGNHITISRFSEERSPEQIKDFLRLMKSLNRLDSEIILDELELGSFRYEGPNLTQTSYASFNLS